MSLKAVVPCDKLLKLVQKWKKLKNYMVFSKIVGNKWAHKLTKIYSTHAVCAEQSPVWY